MSLFLLLVGVETGATSEAFEEANNLNFEVRYAFI